MLSTLSKLEADCSAACLAAALVTCLTAGLMLGEFLQRAQRSHGPSRWIWLCGSSLVAGLGAWTAHFIALIGYRPHLQLNYSLDMTAASALIGILSVGLPLAATVIVRSNLWRVALGAAAGIGIIAMHVTGMSALEGRVQVQSSEAAILACLIGAVLLAASRGIPKAAASNLTTCLLFTAAVYSTQFTAISGLSITRNVPSSGVQANHTALNLLVLGGALAIFVSTLSALIGARRFEAKERAHAAVLSKALRNMPNGLVFIDVARCVELFNDRFVELFALSKADLRVGMSAQELLDRMADAGGWTPEESAWARNHLALCLQPAAIRQNELVRAMNQIVQIESHPVAGGGFVFTFDDVTDARNAQRELSRLAYHDALTGLGNWHALAERLEDCVRSERCLQLLVLDLDRFKVVNDTYGYAVGDQLLVQVGDRLRAVVGNRGFLARLGADEMAVLADGDNASSCELAASLVEAIAQPFRIGDISITVGCSIGISSTADAQNPEGLMQRSDIALSEAKRQGRGCFACYRAGLRETAVERQRLLIGLQTALPGGEFHLVYQPIVSLDPDEVIGYEALVRWNHPDLGPVSPAVFIPLAEESGHILPIGQWVLAEACREAARWTSDRHVAVNVSTVQFRSSLLYADVVAALAASGLPAHRLEIELTETALVEDGTLIANVLADLRKLGIKIAMDDFGTGYSSLAHMRDFPVDRIKIDRSFVAAAETDPHSMAVIKAVLLIGRDLDIATLAEGVETASQLKLMRDLGCGSVQGYLLGRPTRLDPPRTSVAA